MDGEAICRRPMAYRNKKKMRRSQSPRKEGMNDGVDATQSKAELLVLTIVYLSPATALRDFINL